MLQSTFPTRSAGSSLSADARCTPQWRDFRTLNHATATYSTDTSSFDRYKGLDLEPDHAPWPIDAQRRSMSAPLMGAGRDWSMAGGLRDAALEGGGRLQVGECTRASANKSIAATWHTQYVGPFTTVGGYDWTQVSWSDPSFVTRNMQAGGKVAIAATLAGPVSAELDDAIGHPPINTHHVHISSSAKDVYLEPLAQWSHTRVSMMHGDWNFDRMEAANNGALEAMGQVRTTCALWRCFWSTHTQPHDPSVS